MKEQDAIDLPASKSYAVFEMHTKEEGYYMCVHRDELSFEEACECARQSSFDLPDETYVVYGPMVIYDMGARSETISSDKEFPGVIYDV